MNNKIKIYLAGSTGQLGSCLKEKILKEKRYKLISKKIDLTNKTKTNFFLKKISPDIIINCAGLSDVNECEKNRKKAIALNCVIPENLSNYCLSKNTYLVHISTDHLYNSPCKKNTETNTIIKNFYAKSKILGETKIKNNNSIIIRTNFFGHTKKKKGLINWLEQSAKNNEIIKIYTNIFFSPLHITTLCKIILKILPKRINGIYNIGSKNGMSKSNFIKKIIEIKKMKIKYEEIKYKHKDVSRPQNMKMNLSKFEKKFSIKLPKLKSEILKIDKKL